MAPRIIGALLASVVVGASAPATAQSVAVRSPNIAGGFTAAPGVVQLNFLHRFAMSDAPLRKITNTPTFNVGTGLTDRLMVGFVYGSNSTLIPAYPNEWELYARGSALSESRGAPLDVSVQGGYNVASESVDGQVLLARQVGRLRLLAAGRAFSQAYAGDSTRYAVTGGAAVRLTSNVSLAGDYGVLLDRIEAERPAWSAGVQLGVPYTPHSFSIHASNVGTASLEGVSRGGRTRWGFEYTIPITVRRYVPKGGSDDHGMADMPSSDMGGGDMATPMGDGMMAPHANTMPGKDTVYVDIHNLKYGMETLEITEGTTVVWTNKDPLQHSVIADGEAFDSGLIDPTKSFSNTFMKAGEYPYHCMPHPFMKGMVVVKAGMDAEMDGGEVSP